MPTSVRPQGESNPLKLGESPKKSDKTSMGLRSSAFYLFFAMSLMPHLALGGPPHVETIQDLAAHFDAHVERVGIIAVEALKKMRQIDPLTYGPVTKDLVRARAAYHDVYKNVAPYSELLFSIYGKNIMELPEVERQRIKRLLGEMNRKEEEFTKIKFYKARGIPISGPVGYALEKVVKMGDLVDRGMDPIANEEFGKGGKGMIKASDLGVYHGQENKIVMELEAEWARITVNVGSKASKDFLTCFRMNLAN